MHWMYPESHVWNFPYICSVMFVHYNILGKVCRIIDILSVWLSAHIQRRALTLSSVIYSVLLLDSMQFNYSPKPVTCHCFDNAYSDLPQWGKQGEISTDSGHGKDDAASPNAWHRLHRSRVQEPVGGQRWYGACRKDHHEIIWWEVKWSYPISTRLIWDHSHLNTGTCSAYYPSVSMHISF